MIEPAAEAPVQTGALDGRVILVVGAHGGLGEATSLACAQAGASVVLLGRRVPKLNRVHDRLQRLGATPALYPMDLEGASPDDHAELAARIDDAYGRLDGIVHLAAAFDGLTPLELTDPAVFARILHVNLTARWWLTQACLPLLRRADDGAVVFAIDDPARTGGAYWGSYGLAQAGLAALVGMLQAELGDGPVRISGLVPPPMRTALRARAHVEAEDRIARAPDEIAAHCVTLLSSGGAAHRGALWAPAEAGAQA